MTNRSQRGAGKAGIVGLGKLQALVDGAGSSVTSRELLNIVRDGLNLTNAAYLALHVPPLTASGPYIEVTYSDEWVAHYRQEKFVEVDPVLTATLKTILPTDWATLDKSPPRVRKMFADAERFGVGRQGLTIPIRGSNGELAIFSITLDVDDEEWIRFKKESMPLIQIVSHYYHERVLATHNITFPDIKLPPKQLQVLSLASNGKGVKEIAIIMKISPHTVATYLEMARAKLQALNTAHAVARAQSMNLIPPPK